MNRISEKSTRGKTGAPLLARVLIWTGCLTAMNVSAGVRCAFLDSALVNDTIIRLGDIAVITETPTGKTAESLAGIPVGEAAPAGYSRFVNIDDVMRHVLHGVKNISIDKSITVKRISVRTGFQEVTLEDYEKEFLQYLRSRIGWKDGDYQAGLIDKNVRLKCFKRPFTVSFDGPSSKYPKGNFLCKFTVCQGARKISVPVSAFISITTPVVVATANIMRGAPISIENCHLEKKDITHLSYIPYTELKDIENRIVSRSIDAGSILHEKNTISIPMVTRDDQVQLVVTKGNIKVCISARARESGGRGKSILVENEMTHKLIKAKIVNPGQVLISQGDEEI